MKKIVCLCLICITAFTCVACSVQCRKPEGGFWYCEELRTGIDFDLYKTTQKCTVVYHDDGSSEIGELHFDFGSGISLYTISEGQEYGYCYGTFKYNKRQDKCEVTTHSDGTVYIFVRQKEHNVISV